MPFETLCSVADAHAAVFARTPSKLDESLAHPPLVPEEPRARAARCSCDSELAQQGSGIRDLPCLDDQPVAEVREDDLVDLEGLPCG